MKNQVVLMRLFGLCPPPLLAKFRLVCKEWRDLSLEPWRASTGLSFNHNWGKVVLNYHDVHDFVRSRVDVPLQKFLQYMEDPENQCQTAPFRHYGLTGQFKFPLDGENKTRTQKLWELVKRDARTLGLYGCLFPNLEDFREVIYRSCPNLQELKLQSCRVGDYPPHHVSFAGVNVAWDNYLEKWYTVKTPPPTGLYPKQLNLKTLSILMEDNLEKFPLTWLELFTQFPRLTRLYLGIHMPEYRPEDKPFVINALLLVLEAIKDVRAQDSRILPLEQFDIHPHFETSPDHKHFRRVFNLLLELRLPLRSLTFRMDSKTKRKFYEFSSEIDGRRLKSLILLNETGFGISTWKIPFRGNNLDNLSVLRMAEVIWENMEFLQFTPNLEELTIIDSKFMGGHRCMVVGMISKTRKARMTEVRLLKMKEFTWAYELTEDDLRHVVNWFPNLRSLHTALDDKLFALVCQHWRGLEVLMVRGAELTDKGVTGLGVGQVMESLDRAELPPNIRLLQNLTCFKYPDGELTDVSVFNGLLMLPLLKNLALGEREGTKTLSEMARAALARKLSLEP